MVRFVIYKIQGNKKNIMKLSEILALGYKNNSSKLPKKLATTN